MPKFSICNEIFENWTWPDTVHAIADAGYDGVEIAPFTLARTVTDLSAESRRTIRRQAEDVGLEIVGLHWLFVSPQGLHATTDDAETRQRTTAYLEDLIRFCGDLGGRVMIIGSPRQRDVQAGVAYETAWQRFVDMIVACLDLATERGVTLCIEALPADQTNFVTSLAEAVRMVQEVHARCPASGRMFQSMFDVHNAYLETDPLPELLQRYMPYVKHVHVNEMDGGYPGSGDFDFGAILYLLERENYRGYISAEVFDFSPGPVKIARDTLRYLKSLL
jgi:D-psicose/D-tagatose/L-ribulose 3-epimerase